MFNEIKKLKDDLCAPTKNLSKLRSISFAILSHQFHLTFMMRAGSAFLKIPIIGKLLSWIVEYLIRIIYASDISCKASINGGLNIMHGHDIVIGANVIIGRNVKIFNGVTLGNKNTETSSIQQPTIEDNVIISTGAKILGKITIGKSAIIGANSVVLKDVPSKEIWAGVPAKKIGDNHA